MVASAYSGIAAAEVEKGEGGSLIWSATSAPGRVIYSLAVGEDALYVVGNAQGKGGLIEKRKTADGSLIWSKKVDVSELMHIDIDSEYMYLGSSPWAVQKRRLSDGSLIWKQKSDEFGGKPYGLVVDSTGIYLAGRNGSRRWRVEKRSLEDGTVLWSHLTVGGVALAVATDDEGVYLGGYDLALGQTQWRIERRSLDDGSLVWKQAHNPSDKSDKVYGMAVDDSGVYAAGVAAAGRDGRLRIEKRDRADGSLIWKQTKNPSPQIDKAHGLTADSTGLYIPGYQDSKQWRIEKRSLADGSLLWEALSVTGGRLWYAVDVDEDAVYVGGYANRQWRIEKRAK